MKPEVVESILSAHTKTTAQMFVREQTTQMFVREHIDAWHKRNADKLGPRHYLQLKHARVGWDGETTVYEQRADLMLDGAQGFPNGKMIIEDILTIRITW